MASQRVGHELSDCTELSGSDGKESACNARDLGWKDPLEKETATHSSILAWKTAWMEEPGRLQSMGLQSQTRLSDFTFFSLSFPTNVEFYQQSQFLFGLLMLSL